MTKLNETYNEIAEEKKELINQSFRDSVATIDQKGRRNFLFPRKPRGRLYRYRTFVSLVFLTIFFTLPFIKVDGQPLFLFNVVERKFILFGQIFWPQDFFIFAIGFLASMVFIIVFTVVFGRVFCGWICPHTNFMEMVFRKIEYWIDGDAQKQKQLKAMPWNAFKLRKRATKIALFYALSFVFANFFLAYIVGMEQLEQMVSGGIAANFGTFFSLIGFTTVFFFVFYWFREQACLVVCPYGRLQGVLLDKKSMVVAYDFVRGEPRGKLKRASITENQGDCIDCLACVRVCPTGIDIRNGTQLECVNCTACIDACNAIMDSINKPRGLVRIDSEENIEHSRKTKLNWRLGAYSFVLIALVGFLAYLLISRSEVDASVLRTPGQIFQTQPDGRISNMFNIKLANKTRKEVPLTLKLENMPGEITVIGRALVVPPESYFQSPFFVKIDKKTLVKRKTRLRIGVYEGNKKIETAETTFIGPAD